MKKCRDDIYRFLNHENGQVAIYDAVNPLASGRRTLAKEFAKHNVNTLFIESACDDERIIEENVRSVKISSPDYVGYVAFLFDLISAENVDMIVNLQMQY